MLNRYFSTFRKTGLLLCCLCLTGMLALAAPGHRIARLQLRLAKAAEDVPQADVLNQLSAAFLSVNVDSALAYARQAYDLSRKLNHPRGIGEARLNQAYALIRKGLQADATATLKKAEVEFVQSNDVPGMGKVALCQVEFHLAEGHVLNALVSCLRADSMFAAAGAPTLQARTRLVQARLFRGLGSDSLALTHLQEAESLFVAADSSADPADLPEVYLRMAEVQEALGDAGGALDHSVRAWDAFRETGDVAGEIAVLARQARLQGRLGQPGLQLKAARSSLQLAVRAQDSLGLVLGQAACGWAFVADARPDSAGPYFARALALLRALAGSDRPVAGMALVNGVAPDWALVLGADGAGSAAFGGLSSGGSVWGSFPYGVSFLHGSIGATPLGGGHIGKNGGPNSGIFDNSALRAWTLDQGRALAFLGLAQTRLARQDYDRAVAATDSVLALTDTVYSMPRAAAYTLRQQLYTRTSNSRQAYLALRAHRALATDHAAQVVALRARELRIRLAYADLLASRAAREHLDSTVERYVGIVNQHDMFLLIALGVAALLLLILVFVLFRGRARRRAFQRRLRKRDEDLDEADQELQIVQQRLSDLREETFRQPAPVVEVPAEPEVDIDALVALRTQELRTQVTRLSALNQELDTFMYRASHDLLGPIARLKGLILVARNSSDNLESLSNYIGLIEAVSVYMDRVLRKLILVHDLKHSSGLDDFTDIAGLVEDITPHLSELPGIHRPVILLHDEVEEPVQMSTYLLRIVLENLLENACIFRADMTDPNPRISVRLTRVDGEVVITLQDEGIGIPDAVREQVFDIFFRGSERSKGNGLGLYLVKLAVEQLGGELELESEEGAFTRVVVRIGER